MDSNSEMAFVPLGNTVAITAAATAPTGVQALVNATTPVTCGTCQYRVINSGTVTVFLGVGANATAAANNAAEAVSGTPAAGIPLLPGAVEVLRFDEGVFFSGKASANTTIYITPGQGL